MSANLLELQETLRNIPMDGVQRVAKGESGQAPQILAMDELKRRNEMQASAQAESAEQGMQEPSMIDQYLQASQGIPAAPGPPPGMQQGPPPGMGQRMPQGMPPQMPPGPPPGMSQGPPQMQQGLSSLMPKPPQQGYAQGGKIKTWKGYANGGQVQGYADGDSVLSPEIRQMMKDRDAIAAERGPNDPKVLELQAAIDAASSSDISNKIDTSQIFSDIQQSIRDNVAGIFPTETVRTSSASREQDYIDSVSPHYRGMPNPSTPRVATSTTAADEDRRSFEETQAVMSDSQSGDPFRPPSPPNWDHLETMNISPNSAITSEFAPGATRKEEGAGGSSFWDKLKAPFQEGYESPNEGRLDPLWAGLMSMGANIAAGENVGTAGIAGIEAGTDRFKDVRDAEGQALRDKSEDDYRKKQGEFIDKRIATFDSQDLYLEASKIYDNRIKNDPRAALGGLDRDTEIRKIMNAMMEARGRGVPYETPTNDFSAAEF